MLRRIGSIFISLLAIVLIGASAFGQSSALAEPGEFFHKAIYRLLRDANQVHGVGMYDSNLKQFAKKKKEYRNIFLR